MESLRMKPAVPMDEETMALQNDGLTQTSIKEEYENITDDPQHEHDETMDIKSESVTHQSEISVNDNHNPFENVQLEIKQEVNFSIVLERENVDSENTEDLDTNITQNENFNEENINVDLEIKNEVQMDESLVSYDYPNFDDAVSTDSTEASALQNVETCLQDEINIKPESDCHYDESHKELLNHAEVKVESELTLTESHLIPNNSIAINSIDGDVQPKPKALVIIHLPHKERIGKNEEILPNSYQNDNSKDFKHLQVKTLQYHELYKDHGCDIDSFQLNSITGNVLSLEQEAYGLLKAKKKMKNVTAKPYACSECPKTYAAKSGLRAHWAVHRTIERRAMGIIKGKKTRKINLDKKIVEELHNKIPNVVKKVNRQMRRELNREGTKVDKIEVKRQLRGEMKKETKEGKKAMKRQLKGEMKKEGKEYKKEVTRQLKGEVKKETKEDKKEMKRQLKGEVKKETKEDKKEMKRQLKREVKKETNEDRKEMKKQLKCEVKKEVKENKTEIKRQLKEEIKNEVKKQTKRDTKSSQSKKEGYECTCGKVFQRRSRMETCLRSHNLFETNSTCVSCLSCTRKFKNKDELSLHRKRLHRKKFPCKFCPTDYDTRKELFKHLQIHQKVQLMEYKVISEVMEGKHKLRCFMCSKSWSELSELKTHVMNEHKGPYVCPRCKNTFPKIIDFGNHTKMYHPEVEGQSVLDVIEAFSRLVKAWKCEECELQFLEADKLALHQIEKHSHELRPECQFQCIDCRRVFISQKGLTSHRRIHHSTETPEETKEEEKGIMCLECRKICKDMTALTSHMRLHSPERKYPCKFCDFRFATPEKRKAHAEIHTGDMKYVCFICEYQCSSENRLKQHKVSLKHANMKEYLLTGKPLLEEPQSSSKQEKIKDKKELSVKRRKKEKEMEIDEVGSSSVYIQEVACDICGDKFPSESEMLEHKQIHPFIEFPNDDKPSRIFFK